MASLQREKRSASGANENPRAPVRDHQEGGELWSRISIEKTVDGLSRQMRRFVTVGTRAQGGLPWSHQIRRESSFELL
jgi:hypothetical protein